MQLTLFFFLPIYRACYFLGLKSWRFFSFKFYSQKITISPELLYRLIFRLEKAFHFLLQTEKRFLLLALRIFKTTLQISRLETISLGLFQFRVRIQKAFNVLRQKLSCSPSFTVKENLPKTFYNDSTIVLPKKCTFFFHLRLFVFFKTLGFTVFPKRLY